MGYKHALPTQPTRPLDCRALQNKSDCLLNGDCPRFLDCSGIHPNNKMNQHAANQIMFSDCEELGTCALDPNCSFIRLCEDEEAPDL